MNPDKCKHETLHKDSKHCTQCGLYCGPLRTADYAGPRCVTCSAPINVGDEIWWQAVPGQGDLCNTCHKTWEKELDHAR